MSKLSHLNALCKSKLHNINSLTYQDLMRTRVTLHPATFNVERLPVCIASWRWADEINKSKSDVISKSLQLLLKEFKSHPRYEYMLLDIITLDQEINSGKQATIKDFIEFNKLYTVYPIMFLSGAVKRERERLNIKPDTNTEDEDKVYLTRAWLALEFCLSMHRLRFETIRALIGDDKGQITLKSMYELIQEKVPGFVDFDQFSLVSQRYLPESQPHLMRIQRQRVSEDEPIAMNSVMNPLLHLFSTNERIPTKLCVPTNVVAAALYHVLISEQLLLERIKNYMMVCDTRLSCHKYQYLPSMVYSMLSVYPKHCSFLEALDSILHRESSPYCIELLVLIYLSSLSQTLGSYQVPTSMTHEQFYEFRQTVKRTLLISHPIGLSRVMVPHTVGNTSLLVIHLSSGSTIKFVLSDGLFSVSSDEKSSNKLTSIITCIDSAYGDLISTLKSEPVGLNKRRLTLKDRTRSVSVEVLSNNVIPSPRIIRSESPL